MSAAKVKRTVRHPAERPLTPAMRRYLIAFQALQDAQRRGEHHGVEVARKAMLSALGQFRFTEAERRPSYRFRGRH